MKYWIGYKNIQKKTTLVEFEWAEKSRMYLMCDKVSQVDVAAF